MKINTSNNLFTVPLPRRSNLAYENFVSEWRNSWLSWLILCISLALGLGFSPDIQAGNRTGSCGGHNQRPCNASPTWLGGDGVVPLCDSGLAEDFVKHKCVDDKIGKAITGGGKDVAKVVVTVVNASGQRIKDCTGGIDKCAPEIFHGYYSASQQAVTKIAEAVLRDADKKAKNNWGHI
jgi:hypothetical protein